MRIVFVVAGTEGDARPNIALGLGLRAEGHDVVVLTSRDFEALVTESGLTFSPLTADFRRMMDEDRARLDGKPAIIVAWRGFRLLREKAGRWVAEALPAIDGAGLIVGSGGALYFASTLAESREIPFVRTVFNPVEPSREIPPVIFRPPPFRLPGRVNLFLYAAMRHISWQFGRPVMARLHAGLGLPPPSRLGPWASPWLGRAPILHAFSPLIVTPPRSWGAHVATTGFWVLRRHQTPSAPLERFLNDGPAPIYVGFGSMAIRELADFASKIQEAIRMTGRRAVVLSGWSGLASSLQPDDGIMVVEQVAHEWLFPRVRLAVHHCGAGTLASVVRAGIPSVVIPFIFDQFFWGRRLHDLGVAPRPLSRKRLDARRLADAIIQADTPSFHEAARSLGERLRTEDGVANAVEVLRRWRLIPSPADASCH